MLKLCCIMLDVHLKKKSVINSTTLHELITTDNSHLHSTTGGSVIGQLECMSLLGKQANRIYLDTSVFNNISFHIHLRNRCQVNDYCNKKTQWDS